MSIQSCPLQGVAANGNVHLIWLERGARTHPQHHHPVPQGCPLSKNYWLTMPLVKHSLDNTKRHTLTSRTLHNTTHFLYGWSKSTNWTGLEGVWQRSKVSHSGGEHHHSRKPISINTLQQARQRDFLKVSLVLWSCGQLLLSAIWLLLPHFAHKIFIHMASSGHDPFHLITLIPVLAHHLSCHP